MINLLQMTLLITLIVIARGHVRFLDIYQLRLNLTQFDGEPIKFQLWQDVRLIRMVHALVQLLLAGGLSSDLQIKLIVTIVDWDAETLVLVEYFVRLVRFHCILNDVALLLF